MSDTALHDPASAPTAAPEPAANAIGASPPVMELQQEVRFAVVMYGGVSLAIYINGVAQELLELVRATAPDPASDAARPLAHFADTQLHGAGPVYRDLGRILGRERAGSGGDRDGGQDRPSKAEPIHTRFLVDVISGTSAGGINGVYLAKALANEQSIDDLKALWLVQGDMGKLLNDAESVEGGLVVRNPPSSLLNSQRMYRELVQALENMGDDAAGPSCLLDELDLFVTSTDLQGLPIDLRLADRTTTELRHRNVFHFRYADPRLTPDGKLVSDFGRTHNPMLAFAARCTSSFPVAFEPMQLVDADPVLVTLTSPPGLLRAGSPPPWAAFFPDYLDEPGQPTRDDWERVWTRSFADGGYLDNKPFGYAIDALPSRHSQLPVSRKLLYIEPDPENVHQQLQLDPRPDAISNGLLAMGLARYETIREDLERILARNRLAERVERVLEGVDLDVAQRQAVDPIERMPDYGEKDIADMIQLWGVSYGGYHRLKVSAVTDEIAEMVRDALKLAAHSDDFLAVRCLVRAWREKNFVAMRSEDTQRPPRLTENRFLQDYDLSYRIRRLEFTLRRLERLYCLDDAARTEMGRRQIPFPVQPSNRAEFREALAALRRPLDQARSTLEKARAELHLRGAGNPLASAATAVIAAARAAAPDNAPASNDERPVSTDATRRLLKPLLDPLTESGRQLAAATFIAGDAGKALLWAADVLRERVRAASHEARTIVESALPAAPGGGTFAAAAVQAVRQYYDTFEYYDVATFPTLFGTDVGEEHTTVDVFRVSRKDTTLRSELQLAGVSFGHFGAFLDRRWRWNDILWGRLDGAERIIAALLPGEARAGLRQDLTREAHTRILRDELTRVARMDAVAGAAIAQAVPDAAKADRGQSVVPLAVASLARDLAAGTVDDAAVYHFFADPDGYDVDRQPEPEPTMRMAGRAARVTGRLLDGIGMSTGKGNLTRWAARAGTILWAVVEVAVPGSLVGGFFRHWAKLLLAFSALLLVAGIALNSSELARTGGLVFGVVAIFRLASAALPQLLKGRRRVLLPLAIALVLAVLALAAYGAYVLTRPGALGQAGSIVPTLLRIARSIRDALGAAVSTVAGFVGRAGPMRFVLSTLLILVAGGAGWFFGRRSAGRSGKPGRIMQFVQARIAHMAAVRLQRNLGLPEEKKPGRLASAYARVRHVFSRG